MRPTPWFVKVEGHALKVMQLRQRAVEAVAAARRPVRRFRAGPRADIKLGLHGAATPADRLTEIYSLVRSAAAVAMYFE